MRQIEIINKTNHAAFKKAVNLFLKEHPSAKCQYIAPKGLEGGKGFIGIYEIEIEKPLPEGIGEELDGSDSD